MAQSLREGRRAALAMADALGLITRTAAVEVGCGAGFLADAHATRWRVCATEASPEMVAVASTARGTDVAEQLAVIIGDAYSLPFTHDWFDLVVVIRVLAWLRDRDRALGGNGRVAGAKGHVIFAVANRSGLHSSPTARLPTLAHPEAVAECAQGSPRTASLNAPNSLATDVASTRRSTTPDWQAAS